MELKAKHAFDVYEDYTKTGDDDAAQVYIKADADEVISTIRAERDEYRYNLSCARNEIHNLSTSMKEDVKTIAELKKQVHDYAQGLYVIQARAEKEARHQKWKRCLAMAGWCEERCERYDLLQEHSGFSWRREIDFYFRWHCRWLDLAEKFKDGV